jgi:hypothetical protein
MAAITPDCSPGQLVVVTSVTILFHTQHVLVPFWRHNLPQLPFGKSFAVDGGKNLEACAGHVSVRKFLFEAH